MTEFDKNGRALKGDNGYTMNPCMAVNFKTAWLELFGWLALSLVVATGWPVPATADENGGTAPISGAPSSGEMQERGVPKAPLFKNPPDRKVMPQPSAPAGSPPAATVPYRDHHDVAM